MPFRKGQKLTADELNDLESIQGPAGPPGPPGPPGTPIWAATPVTALGPNLHSTAGVLDLMNASNDIELYTSGYIDIASNSAVGPAQSGETWLYSGETTALASSGSAGVGTGNVENGTAGSAWLYSGDATGTGASGTVIVTSGNVAAGASGEVRMLTGNSSAGNSSAIHILTGTALAGLSGDIILEIGDGATDGNLKLVRLRTTDPVVTDAFFLDNGVLTKSGSSQSRRLYTSAVSSGNTAATSEDTVKSYTMPANLLANVGDMIHIVAAGVPVSSTDAKVMRVKFGGTNLTALNFPVSTTTRAFTEIWITKTGSSTQASTGFSVVAVNNAGQFRTAPNITDTAPIVIAVSCQNTSNPVANSANCDFLTIEYLRAP